MNKIIIKKSFARMQKIAVSKLRDVWDFKYVPIWVFLFCLSCGNKSEADEPDEPIISLEGTKWKLAGIMDAKTGSLQELEPRDCEECYTLTFDTDSTAQGLSVSNKVFLVGLNPIRIGCATEIVEIFGNEVNLYCNTLGTVTNYSFGKNELKFYYNDNKNFLLFKPFKP